MRGVFGGKGDLGLDWASTWASWATAAASSWASDGLELGDGLDLGWAASTWLGGASSASAGRSTSAARSTPVLGALARAITCQTRHRQSGQPKHLAHRHLGG